MNYYTLLFGYNPLNDAIFKNNSNIVKLFERLGFIVNKVCISFNTGNAKCRDKDHVYFIFLIIIYIFLIFLICYFAKKYRNK